MNKLFYYLFYIDLKGEEMMENNVTDFVLSKAKVVDKAVPFDELMGSNP